MSTIAVARSPRHAAGASRANDFLYDAVLSAAVGGSVLALVVLAADMAGAGALHTPSLIGTTLLTGRIPAPGSEIRLDMVAAMTAFHFAAFMVFGFGAALACRAAGAGRCTVLVLAPLLFVALTMLSLVTAAVLVPGLVGAIGASLIVTANAVTALAMALALSWAHRGTHRA